MRKSIFSLLICAVFALIATVSLTGCSAETTLEMAVEQVAKTCPIDAGDGMVIKNIYIAGNDVVYDCTIDGSGLTADDFANALPEVKKGMTESMQNDYKNDSDVKTFIDLAFEANKDIKYVFKETATGKSVEFTMTAREIAGK